MLMSADSYRRLQKAAGLSNAEAADFLGLNISTIKRYRNGQLEAPKAVLLALKYKAEEGK